jgi:hypothetical protein
LRRSAFFERAKGKLRSGDDLKVSGIREISGEPENVSGMAIERDFHGIFAIRFVEIFWEERSGQFTSLTIGTGDLNGQEFDDEIIQRGVLAHRTHFRENCLHGLLEMSSRR